MSPFRVIGLIICSAAFSYGGDPWARTYGQDDKEYLYGAQPAKDGGLILAGYTESAGAGEGDAWCTRLDAAGRLTWQKAFGGKENDHVGRIILLKDGNYLLGGSTESYGAGKKNAWLLKVNPSGKLLWQRQYGIKATEGTEVLFYQGDILQTVEGDYFACGRRDTEFTDSNPSSSDAWCARFKPDGKVLWSKCFSAGRDNALWSAQQTSDGGFILGGQTGRLIEGSSEDDWDAWCLKLKGDGALEWAESYSDNLYDDAADIRQTSDGGYIFFGDTGADYAGYARDLWLMKLSSVGKILWQKGFGRGQSDIAYELELTADGGYLLGCDSQSAMMDHSNIVCIKTDSSGKPLWQHAYYWKWGWPVSFSYPWTLLQMSEGGYFVVGSNITNDRNRGFVLSRTSAGTICPNVTSKVVLPVRKSKLVAKSLSIQPSTNSFSMTKTKPKISSTTATDTDLCAERVE